MFPFRSDQRGATLMEVLVSVVVMSVGMLGIGAMLAVGNRMGQIAYQKTQAGFIAQTLIESMHLNASGVNAHWYEGDVTASFSTVADCRQNGCSARAMAEFDRARVASMLRADLPNGRASVSCSDAKVGRQCELAIAWQERAGAGPDAPQQSLRWTYAP